MDVAVPGRDNRRGALAVERASSPSIAAVTSGMSARITTAATASSGTEAIPARTDALFPSAQSGFSTVRHAKPASSPETRPAS